LVKHVVERNCELYNTEAEEKDSQYRRSKEAHKSIAISKEINKPGSKVSTSLRYIVD